MSYIITQTKIRFEFLDPKPEHILIEDIAHALSQTCRFNGHTSGFFSVAQHSVFVSELVEAIKPEYSLWGLLHDAQEAYVGDITSPLKKIINGNYDYIHDLIQGAIISKFWLFMPEPDEVKRCDRIMTVNELWTLIDPTYEEEGIPRLFSEIPCWKPTEAKDRFLQRFKLCRQEALVNFAWRG